MKPLGVLLLLAFSAFADDTPTIELERVTGGVLNPVAITHAGDSRLFITLQDGRIVIWNGTQLLAQPFLDIRNRVLSGGERGLLSVAFHPQYAQNGLFFVDYTNTVGDTVIARFNVSPTDPNRADPNSFVHLMTIQQPFANHNGGQLAFGPDGYLYIGMGDGGSGGDPGNRAQNLLDLLGKILRIDVNAPTYTVPPSNPFVGQSSKRNEIWAYGLRNPWRFSFDRATGDLWIADVGQGSWEEIDFQPATSIGGENYGWRKMEGTHCFNPTSNCSEPGFVMPIAEYSHSGGACSATGGYVYRGGRSPRLHGTYLFGDYCNGVIRGTFRDATTGVATTRVLLDTPLTISTFGEDMNGELYVADYNNGVLYRLFDSKPMPPKSRAVRK